MLYLPHDDRPHGYMLPEIVEKMPWTSDFKISREPSRTIELLDNVEGKDTSSACSEAFSKVVNAAIDNDVFAILHKQHSEMSEFVGSNYPVRLERFTKPLFGIVSRGAHLTAYSMTPSGMKIWVPRRSAHLYTYPNRLDTTVAGGIKAGESPFETIVHEADEEASLPEDYVRRNALSVGVLTYISTSTEGDSGECGLVIPDTVYVFDIELEKGLVPKPRDDEVKEFYLMSVGEVKEALAAGEFKTNSAVVMIDFFIRHGIITNENERDFTEIVMRMHRKLPFPTAPKSKRLTANHLKPPSHI